jgi:hypothetical protein
MTRPNEALQPTAAAFNGFGEYSVPQRGRRA